MCVYRQSVFTDDVLTEVFVCVFLCLVQDVCGQSQLIQPNQFNQRQSFQHEEKTNET